MVTVQDPEAAPEQEILTFLFLVFTGYGMHVCIVYDSVDIQPSGYPTKEDYPQWACRGTQDPPEGRWAEL